MAYMKMSSFETRTKILGDELFVGLGQGKNIKFGIKAIQDYLKISQNLQFGGVITPEDTPPLEGDWFWIATQAGTYTDFGGIVVPVNSLAAISRIGGVFAASITSISPQDLSGLVEKSSIQTERGDQLFDKSTEVLSGAYVNNTGDLAINSGGYSYAKVDISDKGAETKITFSGLQPFGGTTRKYAAFYQGDTKLTSGFSIDEGLSATLDIPVLADTVLFTIITPATTAGQVDTLMLNYGSIALPLSPVSYRAISVNNILIKNADKEVYSKDETYSQSEVDDLIPNPIDLDKVVVAGQNLADPSHIMAGLVNTGSQNTGTAANAAWRMIWIPCDELTTYRVDGWFGSSIGIGFFSGELPTTPLNTTNVISSGTAVSQGIDRVNGSAVFTTPEDCTWWVITLKNASESESVFSQLMITQGADNVPYEPFVSTEFVSGIDSNELGSKFVFINGQWISTELLYTKGVDSVGAIDFSLSGDGVLDLKNGANQITGYVGVPRGVGQNPMFNFRSFSMFGISKGNTDDVAPMHIEGTTLGANHGRLHNVATISSHGLTNTAIGTAWIHSNGKTYYPIKIVNDNQIGFLSENEGTFELPLFTNIPTGTITRGGVTLTITSVTGAQIYPSIKNLTQNVFTDTGRGVSSGDSGLASRIIISEIYEIMSSVQILDNLKARAGQNTPPVYEGDGIARVENVYIFNANLEVVVLNTFVPLMAVAFSDIMVTQAEPLSLTAQFYVPNSSILNASVDLRKPSTVAWSASIPPTFIVNANQPDPLNPPNRVIQYLGDTGFMVGYIPDIGVGLDLTAYTNRSFEIRNSSGKIYPHPIEGNVVGAFAPVGQAYSTAMYRVYCKLSEVRTVERLSYFTVPYNGETYVFVDYSASVSDRLQLDDDKLVGKKVVVIQEVNAEVLTDINTGSIMINATYVEGATCFVVFKLV